MSKKVYCLDTSVLIDNFKSIEILRNGEENEIYLPEEVLIEIDKHKKSARLNYIAKEVIDEIIKFRDIIKILPSHIDNYKHDDKILKDLKKFVNDYKSEYPFIFVTNDKLLAYRAFTLGIITQEFKDSYPYQSESQSYTGIIHYPDEALVNNCFYWKDGKLYNYTSNTHKLIDYENNIWTLKPRTPYQNAAMELLLNDSLDIITIQSSAGYGKTFLGLASALFWTLQQKKFKKIYIFKHNIDVGDERLGFLPGDLKDKISPYFRPIMDLLIKLHEIRDANRLFIDPKSVRLELNNSVIEFLPVNFIRGMNIDDGYVILDEVQNFSRQEIKVILSRMGENTRVICLGDVEQIDSPYLNQYNNGMNWILKAFKNLSNYGHLVLKGKNSRGKIADMVRNSIL